jgi:hypothetical protein
MVADARRDEAVISIPCVMSRSRSQAELLVLQGVLALHEESAFTRSPL